MVADAAAGCSAKERSAPHCQGNHSLEDLQARVFAFIDYYNRTMAKPFKWTRHRKGFNRLNYQRISAPVY